MITAQDIKSAAKRMGADIVGIGSIDRWSTAPIQMDPKQIMPKAKSIIALGFRVLRGSLRGVEEGTYFSNYSAMGYGGITYLYMPMTIINLSKMIEDAGYDFAMYASLSWTKDYLDMDKLDDVDLWLARWRSLSKGPGYSGKGNLVMWQYTDSGSVPGISGNVDLDISY